jgi:hypothetical protein
MAVDVGTLGSSPSLMVINDMLIKLNDPKITNRVTACYLHPREEIAKLKKYVKPHDVPYYTRLLMLVRDRAMQKVDRQKGNIPKDLYTHLRCAVVGVFRDAFNEVHADRRKM